ncbi:hypothetical protein CkaCkLH20_00707 [Colletotrichum karsti]|uniref:Uncharacterized protein n=1 Tax=Colletotrichum karsti TaxID=1095194 RepID=A0A9P6IGD6_9PEZI|nr:uncharacterized protein CkaCkLH20_00707 [Colletotrichum karsti]KAF9881561.1 hypothetical protein CkaCkLH20_00707 [Colletotrichum karsti]
MSFGWSAGDIAAAVKLLYNVYEALDSCNGAAQEYREAVAFLRSLIQTLKPITFVTDWSAYPAYKTDIDREINYIKVPINDFLQAIQKYEPSLGKHPATTNRFKHAVPKLNWYMKWSRKVITMKSLVQSHMMILDNLMKQLTLDVILKTQKDLPDVFRSVFQETIRPELGILLRDALRQMKTSERQFIPELDLSEPQPSTRDCVNDLAKAAADSLTTRVQSTDYTGLPFQPVAHWSDQTDTLSDLREESLREV